MRGLRVACDGGGGARDSLIDEDIPPRLNYTEGFYSSLPPARFLADSQHCADISIRTDFFFFFLFFLKFRLCPQPRNTGPPYRSIAFD